MIRGRPVARLPASFPLSKVSGYYRAFDAVVMSVGDGLMAIPSILLALALMTLVRAGVETVIAALVVPETPRVVRMARQAIRSRQPAQCMSLDTPRVGILHLLA